MSPYSVSRAALLGALVLVGCSSTDSTSPPPPVAVGSVSVTPDSATLYRGDTLRLHAEVRSQSGEILHTALTWSSADPAVAVVTGNGTAIAIASGQATITASSEGHSGQAVIRVSPAATSADVNGVWDWTEQIVNQVGLACSDTGSYTFGQAGGGFHGFSEQVGNCTGYQGTAAKHPSDSLSGLVGGNRVSFIVGAFNTCSYVGSVSPTSSDSMSGTVSCADTVNRPAGTWQAVREPLGSISITPGAVTVVAGFYSDFAAQEWTPRGNRAFGRSLTWSSGAPDVATVIPDPYDEYYAKATAVGAGRTSIFASGGGVTGSATVVVPPPVALSDAVAAGSYHSCALAATGSAYCWGLNASGQLGIGQYSTLMDTPQAVLGGHSFTAITAGYDFSCALDVAGLAWCWGGDTYGQLGSGSNSSSNVPAAVAGGVPMTAISSGYYHACALAAGGTAYCWGLGSSGQLGSGGTTSNTPVVVSGGIAFSSLAAGYAHTCGISQSGTAYCWGSNSSGQLGDGTLVPRGTPTPVSGSLTFTTISTGWDHTCAVATDGTAYCWGGDAEGALGNGSTSPSLTPTPVAGGLQFTSVIAGRAHSCGIAVGGAAYCWGSNTSGQLGNGDTFSTMTPVLVSGGLLFRLLTSGGDQFWDYYNASLETYDHTCGVTLGGLTYCWGDGSYGDLGTGDMNNDAVPTRVVGQP